MYKFILVLLVLVSCSKQQIITTEFHPEKYKLPKRSKQYISVKRIQTGHNLSAESLVKKDGRTNINHYSSHQAFLLERSGKKYLIDTGMSKDGKDQLKKISLPFRALLDYEEDGDVSSKYKKEIDGIFVTHMHFDHVSALKDLSTKNKTKIYVHAEEYKSAMSDVPPFGYIPEQYNSKDLNWNILELKNIPYGPFSRFKDFFDDGSLLIVELPGHTPGSIGLIINTIETRIFMVGDAVWTIDEVIENGSKSTLASYLVDENHPQTKKTVELLHDIWMANPGLRIVPAHDLKASIFIDAIDSKEEVH